MNSKNWAMLVVGLLFMVMCLGTGMGCLIHVNPPNSIMVGIGSSILGVIGISLIFNSLGLKL